MPRPNRDVSKAKDFKGAIKRLLQELSGFKKLIIISLVLAALGAILTIVTPNILSDLTDEISKGLVLNKDNFEKLTKEVTSSLNEESISKVIDFSEKNIGKVMISSNISKNDLMKFQEIMAKLNYETNNKSFKTISEMPDSILDILVNNDVDAKIFIKSLNSNLVIPASVASKIFRDIEIDGHVIDAIDQGKFLEIASNINEDVSATEVYGLVDNMPSSVKVVVEPYMNIDKIKNIAILLICIYLISAIFEYFEAILMTDVSNNFARKLRGNISSKINKLPLKYFDKHVIGDILSRVTNDVDTIAQSMNQSLSTLVSAITLFVGTIIMMFVTNSIMAITAILASLFGFVFMSLVLSKSQKYFVAKQNELGALNGHIEEVYSGLNVVKTYNGEKTSNEKFDELNDKLYKANWKSEFLSGLMMPMMSFIGNFGYVTVCVVGALLALNGHISFGVIVAFIVYVRLFVSPLSQIAQAMTSLQSTAAASERVFEFLDEKEMADESNIKTTLDKEKVKGNIEFKNVEFKYDGNDKPTIKNFSAKAKAGEKVAIVGPTGAGKTTMVNLLMKFYDIHDGDITIDGKSISDLTRENVHSLFTMVLQDTWLFEGTVKDNIRYNNSKITDKEIESVCKYIGLDHFIKTLPNNYDTVISENDNISAGQKQLLTIARGMCEKAPLLILDEATSNVDTRTEELVQKAMDKLMENKTSFIIAHRLSTIKNADLILVMNEGNIIEQGSHDELMKKDGFYAKLYNSQFEL